MTEYQIIGMVFTGQQKSRTCGYDRLILHRFESIENEIKVDFLLLKMAGLLTDFETKRIQSTGNLI